MSSTGRNTNLKSPTKPTGLMLPLPEVILYVGAGTGGAGRCGSLGAEVPFKVASVDCIPTDGLSAVSDILRVS